LSKHSKVYPHHTPGMNLVDFRLYFKDQRHCEQWEGAMTGLSDGQGHC